MAADRKEPRPARAVAGSRAEALDGVLRELELAVTFPKEVEAEVAHLLLSPGLDDAGLVDLVALPFVTIDGPTSKDLDQAIFVERSGSDIVVHYALADAAHFVPPQSALFAEALRRGASFYLPGRSVPMLPRPLSEGLISLNPGVIRRALTFEMRIDERGKLLHTRIVRGRIQSRRKLSFGEVQRLYDQPEASPLRAEAFAPSLQLLREVGELLMSDAAARDVTRFRRREVEVVLDAPTDRLVLVEEPRVRVELYNEQVSLLTNREGGRMLRESPAPHLQPIYRVHPAPEGERLATLAALTRGVAEAHGLDPARFAFRQDPPESLSDYLERLVGTTHLATLRVARALERQVLLVNSRSTFTAEPAAHFGVGADIYARFSSPMREVVGIFVHKELLELIAASGGPTRSELAVPGAAEAAAGTAIDERLRAEVVDAANRSKDTQRKINEHVTRLVIDDLFGRDVSHAEAERPRHRGTVMGITGSKVHVALDEPPMDVKVYVRDLGKERGNAWLTIGADGAVLKNDESGEIVCRLGDTVNVRVVSHDDRQDRWVLSISVVHQSTA